MAEKYYPPKFTADSFHCPFCGVYSKQIWSEAYQRAPIGFTMIKNLLFADCSHCNAKSIWLDEQMLFPSTGGVELPNQDLPADIVEDYTEAKNILNNSPRGAAALLRLAIQKLCKELKEKGDNINDDIAALVKKGLPLKIQQALDYVRVVGNNAVHPGQIDLKDNLDTALNLFCLINIIADVMISQPKHVDTLYNSLPAEQLKAIEKRDNKTGT